MASMLPPRAFIDAFDAGGGIRNLNFIAIDSMLEDSSRIDFYRSQIVKYMWRLRDKGDPLKDAKKAEFYLCRLIQKLS